MEESWADIVRGYGGGRTWADIVEDESTEESADRPSGSDIPGCEVSWADVVGKTSNDLAQRLAAPDVSNTASTASLDADSAVSQTARGGSPGDPVGIRAIQSILMSATQMNLSHFHTAGMKNIGISAPTAAEAMNFAYGNASMTFEVSPNLDVRSLRKEIVGADLKSFVVTVGGSFTVLPDHENVWYEVLGRPPPGETCSVLRFYIDYTKMEDHGLSLADLAKECFGADVVTNVSPDFMGMIDVEVPNSHFSQWLSRTSSRVCGTFGVKSCDKIDEKRAITRGTDILAVSKVDGIDVRTVTSNDAVEVEARFGVEAAAAVLRELTGSHVVSDFMARTGKLMPFTKSSAEVKNKGLLSSMGFERPKEDIKSTIASGAPHPAKSVYESIITGADSEGMFEVYNHVSLM